MSPSATRRDELEARLESKIDGLTAALSELRELMAGKLAAIEAGVHQAKGAIGTLTLRADRADGRLNELDASKHRAEGAIWAWRMAWLAAAAAAGAASHFLFAR